MSHRFQCRCGTVQGEILQPRGAMRATCYCRDCQAYARLLGQAQDVLDPLGGTDVVATPASNVRLTAGQASLRCLSLSPRGLLRWYAGCCRTPVANTPRDWRLPYVGLVHTCLRRPQPLEQSFPRAELRVNTQGAHGPVSGRNGLAAWLRFARLVLRLSGQRLRGRYRATPFFDAEGRPVATVEVVSREAVEAARRVPA